MKYELGYYDDSILNALNGDEDAFEDMIEKWVSQPAADQLRYLPWYGNEDSCKMQTIAIQEIIKEYQRQKTNQRSRKGGSARKPQQYHAEAEVII